MSAFFNGGTNPLNSIPTVKKKRPDFADYYSGPHMDPYGTSPSDPENVKNRAAWNQGWTQYQADLKSYYASPEGRPGGYVTPEQQARDQEAYNKNYANQMLERSNQMRQGTAGGWTTSSFARQYPNGYFQGRRTLPQGNM
jgi:hypothetical protein